MFISFSSYSSDTVPKGTNVICNIYDAGISAKFKQRSDCEPYVPASTLSACTSNPFWTNSGYYCNQPGGAKKLIGISIIPSSECPYTHPVDLGNGYCGKPEEPEPEPDPHSCPDAGTFVHKTWGREGLNGWSTCRSDNCVVVAQVEGHSSMPSGVCYVNEAGKRICRYDLFYTGQACNFDPNKPGVNPPDHEYPDEPVTPPDTENPPSPDLPDEGGDIEPPIYDPDGEGDGKPDDPVQPPNPDPKPDPDDPNLSDGDNAVVGELSEANQRLENIDHTTQELTNTIKSDNDSLLEYQAHILGEMKQMNQQLADGVGGGGGGGGTGKMAAEL
ncbi:hypothetical protein P7M09_24440, partial [Vibrio parahaemolyticus]|nr:hypothetical protein [Vibrio parahaemolyticus]